MTGQLPELDGIHGKVTLDLLLNSFFRGRGPKDAHSSVLLTRFVVLVDQAVREYNLAREKLQEYNSTPPNHISPLLQASGHIENCIGALRRALRFVHRIRRDERGPPIDRDTAREVRSTERWVATARDAVEHMDEWIMDGRVPDGATVAPLIEADHIELAGSVVSFHELGAAIVLLHGLAERLAEWVDARP